MTRRLSATFIPRANAIAGFIGAVCLSASLFAGPSSANETVLAASNSQPTLDQDARDYLMLQARLDEIAMRIAVAADGQCANRWRPPGFKTHKVKDYPRALRRAVRPFAGSEPRVLAITDPQLHGLIRPGDLIIGAQGRPLDDDSQALQIQLALGRVNILRQGEEITVTGSWPQLCYRPVHLSSSMTVEARTMPNGVEVSQGLINYVRSDDELAYAIAHELSHFMLDHSRLLSEARDDRRLSASFRRSLETDADRGAVFLLHRAGYDVSGAIRFIGRSSVLRDFPLMGLSSHPRRSDRLTIVQNAIDDIFRGEGSYESIADFVFP